MLDSGLVKEAAIEDAFALSHLMVPETDGLVGLVSLRRAAAGEQDHLVLVRPASLSYSGDRELQDSRSHATPACHLHLTRRRVVEDIQRRNLAPWRRQLK